jgi:hypothetical protein
MPWLTVEHTWYEEPFLRVESQPELDGGTGKFKDGLITLRFSDNGEDEAKASFAGLTLDEAERMARQILDVVMDARMGRFTNEADVMPDFD